MGNYLNHGFLYHFLIERTHPSEQGAFYLYLACMLLALVIPYLLGSINSALLISRIFYRDDVRKHGSHNAGLTNMYRVYGKRAALFTLIGDILKTVLAVLAGFLLLDGAGWVGPFALGIGGYLALIGCVMGHAFPLYYHFKGGKGVLCAITAVAILSPYVAIAELFIFLLIALTTRYVSLASVVAVAAYPLVYNMFISLAFESTPLGYITLSIFLVAGLIVFLHRDNLVRLWRHEETKFSFRKKPLVESAPSAREVACPFCSEKILFEGEARKCPFCKCIVTEKNLAAAEERRKEEERLEKERRKRERR